MKDYIYVPIMIFSNRYTKSFFPILANAIKEFDTPDGVNITGVYDASDRLMEHLLEQVDEINSEDVDSSPFEREPYTMLEIEFETVNPVRYKKLPWLDEQIKDVVLIHKDSVALYFFYLIEDGAIFHTLNIAKVYKGEEALIFEDNTEDDLSPIQKMAAFLNHFWHLHPEQPIDQYFPVITAKLLLTIE